MTALDKKQADIYKKEFLRLKKHLKDSGDFYVHGVEGFLLMWVNHKDGLKRLLGEWGFEELATERAIEWLYA